MDYVPATRSTDTNYLSGFSSPTMMRTSLLAFLTLLLAYLAKKFAGRDIDIDDPLTKDLGYQRIQGYRDRGLDLYLGIR